MGYRPSSCSWLYLTPCLSHFHSFSDLWIPTLYSIMGYRQLLYCAFEGRTHSPVRWTHFPLSNGTRGVRNGVNLTDWEFQSETLLLNALTGWILNEQGTLTKHSFALPLLFTACPSLSVSIPSLLDLGLLLFLSFPLLACFVPFSFLSHWQVTKVQLLTRIAKKKKLQK